MSQINKNYTLASNAGAGAGTAITWLGGKGCFTAEASFGGGNVALQMITANGTWVSVANPTGTAVTLSANGMLYFEAPPTQLRAFVTTSTAVFAYVVGIHQ